MYEKKIALDRYKNTQTPNYRHYNLFHNTWECVCAFSTLLKMLLGQI